MSKQEIQLFSLDDVSQEEKDFLVYMYGHDLDKMSEQNPKEIAWWVNAFQAVKTGKRPKFNWAAFFLTRYWCLRKKNFKLALLLDLYTIACLLPFLLLLILDPSSLAIIPGDMWNILYLACMVYVAMVVFLFPMILSGCFGTKMLINAYLLNGRYHRAGRLPFIYLYPIFFIEVIKQFFNHVPLSIMLILSYPLSLMPCIIFLYTLALMKFWLPAKKN